MPNWDLPSVPFEASGEKIRDGLSCPPPVGIRFEVMHSAARNLPRLDDNPSTKLEYLDPIEGFLVLVKRFLKTVKQVSDVCGVQPLKTFRLLRKTLWFLGHHRSQNSTKSFG